LSCEAPAAKASHDKLVVRLNGKEFKVELKDGEAKINGKTVSYSVGDAPAEAAAKPQAAADTGSSSETFHEVISKLPGLVIRHLVKPGDEVKATTPILVLEAMKMETTILAEHDGVLASFEAAENSHVQAGSLLAMVKY